MQWYTDVIKKYVVFSGRARRKEFWMFVLFNVIISIVIGIVYKIIGTDYGNGSSGVLGSIYSLAVLLPSLGVTWRRLHDTDRSGWWILIGLIPIIGWIVLLVFYLQDSDATENNYGPPPATAAA